MVLFLSPVGQCLLVLFLYFSSFLHMKVIIIMIFVCFQHVHIKELKLTNKKIFNAVNNTRKNRENCRCETHIFFLLYAFFLCTISSVFVFIYFYFCRRYAQCISCFHAIFLQFFIKLRLKKSTWHIIRFTLHHMSQEENCGLLIVLL